MKSFLPVLVIALYAISCSPTYYVPTNELIVGLEEKGDFVGNFAYGDLRLGVTGGVQFSAAYAIHDNIGVIGSASAVLDPYSLSSVFRNSIGAGYTHQIDSILFFRSFILTDFGRMERTDEREDADITANFFGLAVNSSLTKKVKFGKLYFSMGLRRIKYKDIWIRDDVEFDENEDIRDVTESYLLEPGLGLVFGKRKLKFYFQTNHSFNLTHNNFPMKHAFFSFGIHWRLNLKNREDS